MLIVRRPATLAALAGAALTLPAGAAAAVPQVEQVNRATGAAGAFSLVRGQISVKAPLVSDDGRFAAWEARAGDYLQEGSDIARATPGDGLFVRDLVQNRTSRIAGGATSFLTGLDRSEHLISFITTEALDRADTNGAPDLYAYERSTGLRLLLSRASGPRGAALGTKSAGSLTRGGRFALFSTDAGVFKRDLLRGTTTRVGAGLFRDDITADEYAYFLAGEGATPDDYASADGRVLATSEGVIAPGRTTPLTIDPGSGFPVTPLITEDGKSAIYQAERASIASVKRLDPATGQVTALPLPPALQGRQGGYLMRLTPDGKAAQVFTVQAGTFQTDVVRWEFATGKVTYVSDEGYPHSRNLKYRLDVIAALNPSVVVVANGTAKLPGTVEAPSPNAYVELVDDCSYATGEPRREQAVIPWLPLDLPAPRQIRVTIADLAGRVLATATVPEPDPSGEYARIVNPTPDAAVRITVTVQLEDGRRATETTTRPAGLPAPTC